MRVGRSSRLTRAWAQPRLASRCVSPWCSPTQSLLPAGTLRGCDILWRLELTFIQVSSQRLIRDSKGLFFVGVLVGLRDLLKVIAFAEGMVGYVSPPYIVNCILIKPSKFNFILPKIHLATILTLQKHCHPTSLFLIMFQSRKKRETHRFLRPRIL